ncbi:ubiquitin conjugating enzyme family protein [Coniophora puteana RWD-64-598 SS2]|uniref:Ubiquitin conjugating enzyme family protein n=1 Tax=Coniophora puteana (strain RWD-64-598) TaxID=741705 RepID=A0A5M3MSJ9_CONPW|nr:ubiquitin conjugating enzyme family protein [Coniophora puteana RWD-64-598 SS2]EIW82142.1 ubiquitin conjugating enzyme family protein [Coniophora puteana RWD-64-598 SS2]
MQAAEHIFEGEFADVTEADEPMDAPAPHTKVDVKAGGAPATPARTPRAVPSDGDADADADEGDDEDVDMDEDEDGDEDQYVDYDSDFEGHDRPAVEADPYAGIFFSKDRREEVIEVEEEPEEIVSERTGAKVKIMTQGEWMKGCPEGSEQGFLFSLYSYLREGACHCPQQCGYAVPRKNSDFFSLFNEFSTYIDELRAIVPRTCPQCKVAFCFACGEPINSTNSRSSLAAEDVLFHCSNIQGAILGVGLAMLETHFIEQRNQSSDSANSQEAKPRTSKRRKTDSPVASPPPNPDGESSDDDDDDDFYTPGTGGKAKGGIGYAGDGREDASAPSFTTGQAEALRLQLEKDGDIGRLLSQIRVYLPSVLREGGGRTSDYMVHPTALAHLRRRFNYVCSTLLRNDSLSDMSDRSVLYFELFEWLETISNHEALASMMAMPIMVVASVKSINPKKPPAKGKSPVRERTIIYEGSSGPRELLEAIVIQSQAAIKGLEGMKPVEEVTQEMTEAQKRMTSESKGKEKESIPMMSEENEKLLAFCQRILATAHAIDRSLRETKGDAFVKRLHASLPSIVGAAGFDSSAIAVGEDEEGRRKAYVDWATQVRFEYCDLTIPTTDAEVEGTAPHYKFFFNTEARMLASQDIPKRSLAIAKELAVLTTNLPVAWNSSIFLRVDETRVDIIKALIIGPEGTPYENGCFLFDIFLGPSYNQSPPNVKYMTTSGGKYRFNPNLYADGKVCLSLLGTWNGPGWVAGKSTLLQVLISIQSMILCEEPYINEPGWDKDAGSSRSLAYTYNVRRMVVRAAMLGYLKAPPEPFEDVIRTHFRLKAPMIAAQLDKWLAEDDGRLTLDDGGGYAVRGGPKGQSGRSTNGFKEDVDEIKAVLQELQSGTSEPSSEL